MIGIDPLLVDIDLQLVGIDQQLAYIWSDLTEDETTFLSINQPLAIFGQYWPRASKYLPSVANS